jgi:hypothetical protein
MRARRCAHVNPVKPLPTITMEVTEPSLERLSGNSRGSARRFRGTDPDYRHEPVTLDQ